MWINTNEFSPVKKPGFMPDPLSVEYDAWVLEQLKRIKYGYEVGGQRITGAHYAFLNFYKVIDKDTRVYNNPRFLDYQADYFKIIERARAEGKGVCTVKRRQCGFSEIAALLCILELYFYEASSTIVATEGEQQLMSLWDKIEEGINTMNNTPFAKNLRVNKSRYKKLGYQKPGDTKWYGNSSEVRAINFGKGDAMKAVSTSPSLLIIDEAGKCKRLVDFYSLMVSALRNDLTGRMSGLPLVFGSTGKMKDSAGLRSIFYNPKAYNMIEFEYETEKKSCGFFVEGWRMYHTDSEGNSNKIKATEEILKRRAIVRESNDDKAYTTEVTQNPLTPKEAFIDEGSSIFDTFLLMTQLDKVEGFNEITVGSIEYVEQTLAFMPNKRGRFHVYRRPEYVNGAIPDGMYIIGVDPYFLDKGTSLGAIYVYKRYHKDAKEAGDLLVCEYLDRPHTTVEFAEDVLKLSIYYNAMVMVEANTNSVKDYFTIKGQLHRLAKKPRQIGMNISAGSSNTYGCPMNAAVKPFALSLVADYVNTQCFNIFFPRLLKELIEYTEAGNYDCVMAFAQVLIYRADLWDFRARVERPSLPDFISYTRDSNGRLVEYKP